MKHFLQLILFGSLLSLCSCAMFDSRNPPPDQAALPVGKNWQIIEEPPKLSNEQGRLPFQLEQSLLPEGAKHEQPTENRTIKTPL